MDVITTHTQADLDGLGAMVAAKRLHPRAVIVLPPALDENVRRFVAIHREAFGMRRWSEVEPETITHLLLVDAQALARTGVPALAALPDLSWEVVDHHPRVPGVRGEIRSVGAATTLLVTRLRAQAMPLTPIEATAMLLGIMADTGRLSHPGTTVEDAEAVTYLLGQGARLDELASYLDPPLTGAQQQLLGELVASHRTIAHPAGEIWLGGATREDPVPEQALVAERLMALYRPAALVLVVAARGRLQLTARSRDPHLDMRLLLAPWGGAGHPTAASGRLETASAPAWVLDELAARVAAWRLHPRTARDLMSSPVRTLELETSVSEASESLRRWGHGAMPVIHHGRPQGVISRRDLDRALHHGFATRPIKGLVGRRVEAVDPDTTADELMARMARLDVGRLLVMQGEELVGIVTRSDLVREALPPMIAPPPVAGEHLEARLAQLWPPDWRAALRTVGRIAGDRPLYLVGGAVRDLLLGHPSFDIDLLVEGDAPALAAELAAELGAEVKEHRPFGTAHVRLNSGERFDLATARLEHYPEPGALPVISRATARQDLARRDFTVNTLAMRLNPGAFGELLDPFGGRTDLHTRTLRVLHPVSFIEDPVRLFRAARFEAQLGFRMEPVTEAYGRYAMGSGRFDGMGGERLKSELRRTLGAPGAASVALRLEDLDAWRMLHPELHLDLGTHCCLRRLQHYLGRGTEERWLIMLAAILAALPPGERELAIAPLLLRRDERLVLEDAWQGLELAPLALSLPAPELAERLDGLQAGGLCLAAAAAPDRAARAAIAHYHRQLRSLKLERVDGTWLRSHGVPPGPVYRELLRELLRAKRAGELPTPAAEEARATAWLASH